MTITEDVGPQGSTRAVSRAHAEAEATELRIWAEQTALEIQLILQALKQQSDRVRSRHPLPSSAPPTDGSSLLDGTLAFTSTRAFTEYRDAGALGALVLTSIELHELADPLLDELKSVAARLARPRFRRRNVDSTTAAINDALLLRQQITVSGIRTAITASLQEISSPTQTAPTIAAGLSYAHGFPVPELHDTVTSADDLSFLSEICSAGASLQQTRDRWVARVTSNFKKVQQRKVDERLRALSLDTLRQAAEGTIKVAPLQDAGIVSVLEVIEMRSLISQLQGIGPDTAARINAAASRLRDEVVADTKRSGLRIDVNPSDKLLTEMLSSVTAILSFDERIESAQDSINDLLAFLAPWRDAFPVGESLLVHPTSPRRGRDVARLVAARADDTRALGLGQVLDTRDTAVVAEEDVWDTFRRRSPDIYRVLGEILGIEPELDAVQGHLASAIADQVNAQQLRLDLMTTSLRGYQAFGAKFALVQRKVVLGDEMGLGKTVQALAAMAHLADGGERHFLVVCPAGVLVNWIHEVRRHTRLTPHRLHGVEKDSALRRWRSRGGIAITTYDTLRGLDLPGEVDIAMLVADEAHLLKNPDTLRSRAVRAIADSCERTLYMTGTPIENVVDDFRNLVAGLQPEVAAQLETAAALIGAASFRELVSPVYLRRISDDVLQELPDLQMDERWIDFTAAEHDAYLDALDDGAFQMMRRVAYVADTRHSSKTEQIGELVEEAVANGKKVLIFSFYKDVLAVLKKTLGDLVIGTITGEVAPERRQQLAEALEGSAKPMVLLSQISAGGVGMNLQAASVVILCEPQVKPSLEDQAIKRAHRMGQIDKVTVYRVLTPESVDQRLLDILGRKRKLIEEYVHRSAVADSSPEAKDMTDTEVARLVLKEEAERHREQLLARRRARPTTGKVRDSEAGPSHEEDSPSSPTQPSSTAPKPATPPRSPDNPVAGQVRAQPPAPRKSQQIKVEVCPSCDRPINQLGYCGCS